MRLISPEDERAIGSLIVRYATAIDEQDWALLRTCFAEDCLADYPGFGVWRGADEICRTMAEMHASVGPTLHRISNIVIDPSPSGAIARSYVDAILMPSGSVGVVRRASGRYRDELVHQSGGWRIARRMFTMIWMRDDHHSASEG